MKRTLLSGAKSRGRNRMIFSFISLLAGVLLFVFLIRLEEVSLKDYETKKVIIATRDISSGVQITRDEIDKYFKCVKVNKEYAVDSFSSIEQLSKWIGKKGSIFSCSKIKQKEIICSDRFISVDEMSCQYEQPVKLGVKVDSYEYCVGGTLRTGDIVDMSIINTDFGSELLLENILVLEAFDSNGVVISPEDEQAVCVGFNIMIEKSDFENYNTALENGTIRLTKKI